LKLLTALRGPTLRTFNLCNRIAVVGNKAGASPRPFFSVVSAPLNDLSLQVTGSPVIDRSKPVAERSRSYRLSGLYLIRWG